MSDRLHNSGHCEDASRRSFMKIGVTTAAGVLFSSYAAVDHVDGQQPPVDLARLTLSEAAGLVRRRRVSPVELTQACLRRIERVDPILNAFITVNAEGALLQAREAEAEIQRGTYRGVLHGIPIGLKDNIDTGGIRTTAGSAVFMNRIPAQDAEVVRRLKRAGAVIIGKLNLDEFAFGHTSTLSHFGPVHNPWKLDSITGGSSGGPAAAVAAHLCYGALGTDTGTSIRTPAAYCGIVGLRPSYGLVSTRGCVPLAPSFDVVGPMCRNVTDTAQVLSVIAGYDQEDVNSVNAPAIDYAASLGRRSAGLRVGVASALVSKIADPEIKAAMDAAVAVVRSAATRVREVGLPAIPDETLGNVLLPEAYVTHEPLLVAAADRYHPLIRQRAEFGRTIGATRYITARRDLERLRRAVARVFLDVDVVLAPTAYATAPTIEQNAKEEGGGGPPPAFPTADFSVYGLPTLSVPCGFTGSGLPIGLQIAGPRFGDAKVLALAWAYERATEWHTRTSAI